jgi:hypothetical protein
MSEAMKFFSGKMIKTIASRRAATSRERSEIDRGGHWRFFPFLLAPKPNRAHVQRTTFILWLGGIARRVPTLGGLDPCAATAAAALREPAPAPAVAELALSSFFQVHRMRRA